MQSINFQSFYLQTKRLFIQQFRTEHITKNYLQALNQEQVVGLTEARHKVWCKKDVIEFISQANVPNKSYLFGVFVKSSSKPIGNVRLFNLHKIHRRAELSFMFYDQEEWGKGFATEALSSIVNFAFEDMNLHRIHADYYEKNLASSRVFEKLGFEIEGIYKDHFLYQNTYVNSIRVGRIAPR